MNEKKSPKSILFGDKQMSDRDKARGTKKLPKRAENLYVSIITQEKGSVNSFFAKSIDFGKNEEKEKGKMM